MITSCIETLIDALDHSADCHPNSKVYFSGLNTGSQAISASDIATISKRYACGLKRLGLQKGDLIGLHLSTRPEFIYSLIGTIRAGGVPVPLPSYSGGQSSVGLGERLAHIVHHSGVRYIISEQRLGNWTEDDPKPEHCTPQWLSPEQIEVEGDGASLRDWGSGDLCLVQYTSGSTAAPKGVALTHQNVWAGLKTIIQEIKLTPADVWCSWLPLYHDMGLIGMLCNLACGASLHLSRPRSFIGNPAAWLKEFSGCGGTLYAGPSFSFTHMLRHISDQQLAELDLSSWRLAFNGSESIDPLVLEQFIQRFSQAGFRASAMFPVYGMAEATLAVSFPSLESTPMIQWVDAQVLAEAGRAVEVGRSSPQARGVVSVGRAVSEHTVRITNAVGAELPETWIGEVQVQGPAVMTGYYADLKQSAAVLCDGWLSTGDLGYISQGLLFITGRAKELIIVNGRKFYPQDVEPLVGRMDGVYRSRCVAFSDMNGPAPQMIVALETNLDSKSQRVALVSKLRSLVSNHLGLFTICVCLLKPGAIPLTSSGKQQRLLLRQQLQQGKLLDKLWPETEASTTTQLASQAS